MQELYIWSQGQEDPLEESMATHSSILTWRIPWTEEPGGLRLQRVGHDQNDLAHGQGSRWHSGLPCCPWISRAITPRLLAVLMNPIYFSPYYSGTKSPLASFSPADLWTPSWSAAVVRALWGHPDPRCPAQGASRPLGDKQETQRDTVTWGYSSSESGHPWNPRKEKP